MKKTLLSIALICLITAVMFIFLEGLCSVVRVMRSVHPLLLERSHTQHDPLLGWRHIPSFTKADLYGPGKGLRINAQGFRGDHIFPNNIPPGKVRVICTGDSFTLGFGVSGERTFCADLEKIDQRLETVNMGQAGYSVGQAYLWYMRDGSVLDHNIHLVAFTGNAFDRIQFDNFGGYATPVFTLKDGKPAVKNYPIPNRSYLWPKLTQNIDTINALNIVKALRKFLGKEKVDTRASAQEPDNTPVLTFEEATNIVTAMFQDLKGKNKEKDSTLVLALVPRPDDHADPNNKWREFVRGYAIDNGVFLIDLTDGLNGLSRDQMGDMYAVHHFSEKGNAWFAAEVHKKLQQFGVLP